MKHLLCFLALSLFVTSASANYFTEPKFCQLDNFFSLEQREHRDGLVRDRLYQIGGLTLTGLAVGKSSVESMKDLALTQTKATSFREEEKFCTFYLNKGKKEQEEEFNHTYLAKPYFVKNHSKLQRKYATAMRPLLEGNGTNLVSCAKDHGYIAMGCNGQKHRGPTAVAMLLAYAGCSPNNAVNIVNSIWGRNFVLFSTRWKLAKMAYDWGSANPKNREVLQSVMLQD